MAGFPTAKRAFSFTFKSFWGVFGWMGVFLDERIYTALLLLWRYLLGAALGDGALYFRDRPTRTWIRSRFSC